MRQNQTYSARAWSQLVMVAREHKQYVPAYLRCLQLGKQGGDDTIKQLDSQLDEPVILLFRRMAHAKFNTTKKKAAADAAKQQPQQHGWIGWLTGSSQRPAQQGPTASATAADIDTSMGPQEWNTLEQLVADQAVSDVGLQGRLVRCSVHWRWGRAAAVQLTGRKLTELVFTACVLACCLHLLSWLQGADVCSGCHPAWQ